MRPICLQALSWGKDGVVFEEGRLHVLDVFQLEEEQEYEFTTSLRKLRKIKLGFRSYKKGP